MENNKPRPGWPQVVQVAGFFLGGILVILVLLCYEAWLWKKK